MVQASRSAPSLKQRYRALFPHSYDHLDNYQHVRCLSRCNLAHHSSHHAGTLTTTDKDKDKDWIAHLCSSSNSVHLARALKGPVFRKCKLRRQADCAQDEAAAGEEVVLKCLTVWQHPEFVCAEKRRSTWMALREAEICKMLSGGEAILPLLDCFLAAIPEQQQQQSHGPGRGGQTRMGQGAKAATRLDVDLHNGHLDLSQEKCLLVLVFPYMSSGTLADVLRRVQHPHSHHISSSLSSGAASSSSSLKQATGGGEWRRVMKEEEVAGVIARLVAALSHAKKRNIVHRDLKAENVLVDDDGQVWLADWGLATFVEQTGTRPAQPGSEAGAKSNGKGKAKAVEEQRQWQSLDGDDTFCGTPAYLSPETASSRRTSHASDVWALGCLAVLLLTGAPAFPAVRSPRAQVHFASQLDARSTSHDGDQSDETSFSSEGNSSDTKMPPLLPPPPSQRRPDASASASASASTSARRAARDLLDRIAVGDWDCSRMEMMRRKISRACMRVVEGMLEVDEGKRWTARQVGDSAWLRRFGIAQEQQQQQQQQQEEDEHVEAEVMQEEILLRDASLIDERKRGVSGHWSVAKVRNDEAQSILDKRQPNDSAKSKFATPRARSRSSGRSDSLSSNDLPSSQGANGRTVQGAAADRAHTHMREMKGQVRNAATSPWATVRARSGASRTSTSCSSSKAATSTWGVPSTSTSASECHSLSHVNSGQSTSTPRSRLGGKEKRDAEMSTRSTLSLRSALQSLSRSEEMDRLVSTLIDEEEEEEEKEESGKEETTRESRRGLNGRGRLGGECVRRARFEMGERGGMRKEEGTQPVRTPFGVLRMNARPAVRSDSSVATIALPTQQTKNSPKEQAKEGIEAQRDASESGLRDPLHRAEMLVEHEGATRRSLTPQLVDSSSKAPSIRGNARRAHQATRLHETLSVSRSRSRSPRPTPAESQTPSCRADCAGTFGLPPIKQRTRFGRIEITRSGNVSIRLVASAQRLVDLDEVLRDVRVCGAVQSRSCSKDAANAMLELCLSKDLRFWSVKALHESQDAKLSSTCAEPEAQEREVEAMPKTLQPVYEHARRWLARLRRRTSLAAFIVPPSTVPLLCRRDSDGNASGRAGEALRLGAGTCTIMCNLPFPDYEVRWSLSVRHVRREQNDAQSQQQQQQQRDGIEVEMAYAGRIIVQVLRSSQQLILSREQHPSAAAASSTQAHQSGTWTKHLVPLLLLPSSNGEAQEEEVSIDASSPIIANLASIEKAALCVAVACSDSVKNVARGALSSRPSSIL